MGNIELENDIKVFRCTCKKLSQGIDETFEAIEKMVSAGRERSYFGISYFGENGEIIYYATAEETFDDEGKKYNCLLVDQPAHNRATPTRTAENVFYAETELHA